MTPKPLLPVLLASLALPAAALGGTAPYVRPATTLPDHYAQPLGAPRATPAPGAWWKRFGDARLDALVDQVLARNNGLGQSAIAVQRARLAVGMSVSNPTISGAANATGTDPLKSKAGWNQAYSGDVTLSYEADLFGRLAAAKAVARFEADATAEDYAAARLSLAGSAVELYDQLACLNERVGLANDSVAYGRKTLALAQSLRAAGSASQLEVSEAEQSLQSQGSTLEDLIRQRVAVRNSIDLLLDGQSWKPAEEPVAVADSQPPFVSAGVPADLLARRPDVRAAELRLRETLRQADVTRLDFYPRLTLTGELGASGASLTNLIQDPVGVLGAGLLLPFLQVDQMRLRTRDARLAYENAVIGFRQTLYQALADVENALTDRRQYARQSRLLAASLASARRVEALDETLYRAGSITLKTWLDAQETRRQTEATLAQSRLNERTAQVTLYKALGGDAW